MATRNNDPFVTQEKQASALISALHKILNVTYLQEIHWENDSDVLWDQLTHTNGDLLELETVNGLQRWVSPLTFATYDRALLPQWEIKTVRVLQIAPAATDDQAPITLTALESLRVPRPGLFRCADYSQFTLQAITSETLVINPQQPVLLFIHDIFSNTDACFGECWEARQGYNASAYLQRLFAPYDQQVFAWEYYSLSTDPLAQALAILSQFPTGTRFHLITQGHGGLIGECLCQLTLLRRDENRDWADSSLVATDAEQQQWPALAELNAVRQQKNITVERFVRIACPVRGNALFSHALADYVSLAYQWLNSLPTARYQAYAEYLRTVLFFLHSSAWQAQSAPGIAAAQPNASLIRFLNRANVQLVSDLSIIAGSQAVALLPSVVQRWVTACFAGEENDGLIQTASMYGGAPRQLGSRFYVDKREGMQHFTYWRDARVRDQVLSGLQHPALDQDFTALPNPYQADSVMRGDVADLVIADKKSTLYFIPGFMGSQLAVNGKPVWLDMGNLAWGDFSLLAADATGVNAAGLLPEYTALLATLDKKYQVVPFAYDWRLSFLAAGRRLGELLTQALDTAQSNAQPKPVMRLLAHSTGGLVVQALLSEMPSLWQRLQQEADCRIVLLGTPLQGTWMVMQLLLGQHRLLPLLDLVDGRSDPQDQQHLQQQFATYPGVMELLPNAYLNLTAWQTLLGDPFSAWTGQATLASAQQVRAQLQSVQWSAQHCVYIHGQAALTPAGLLPDANNTAQAWRFQASREGDGVTLWQSITLSIPTWYMPVEHGCMASREDQFATLQYLLDDGLSRQLPTTAPVTNSSSTVWMPDLHQALFPDERELMAAALGYHTRLTQGELIPAIDVRVIHGNVENSCYPVVVGHYAGDSIVSAEAVLDKALGGRLSELHRLGLYPGELGTAHVFLNPGSRPGGVVVMGLGEVGKLSSGQLTSGFVRTLLDYCVAIRDDLARLSDGALNNNAGLDSVPVHLASLLIGTVGGGSMPLADAITAILRAFIQANLVLDKTESGIRLRLQTLVFMELYEDRAVEAARLLQDLVALPEFRQDFSFNTLMQTAPGHRQRVMYSEPSGWWRRIQIEANNKGLKYTTLTDKARAELLLQATQRKLVDQFIAKAETSSQDDPDTGKVLFELLLPAEMKEQAPSSDNVVLVLDSLASAYPWELLYNRFDVDSQPLAVRVGVLRQLQVGQFRQQVLKPLERSALVIGDPPTDGAFPRLPAAHEEALLVANLLENGGFHRVHQEIGTDPQAILRALHGDDYRVLHLAGHGVYLYQPDSTLDMYVSGMVLGDGIFLTPIEIGQMRRVPELVFINCCHLAKMAATDEFSPPAEALQERSRLAASLAQEFIRMGVRAVIAAGWAINDAAAKVFAQTCYGALLKGHAFGVAVLMARRATWAQYPNSNTWGAYQCYGDPDYKLLSRQPETQTNAAADLWHFVAEVEVITELQNLFSSVEIAKSNDTAGLIKRLRQLHRAIPAEWLNHANVLYELGRAYGRLEQYPEAIEAYDAALQSPQADYPVTLLEDKVSLQTAWAVAWAQTRMAAPPLRVASSPADLMAKSLTILQLLAGLGNSLARFNEEGKFWKRQALLVQGDERKDALQNMEKAYQKAHEFALRETGQLQSYPLVAWLTARLVRYLRGDVRQLERKTFLYWLEQAQQCTTRFDQEESNFCSGLNRAECSLLQYFYHALGARLDEAALINKLVADYVAIMARGAAPRQIQFVSEHLQFLRAVLVDDIPNKLPVQSLLLTLANVENKVVLV